MEGKYIGKIEMEVYLTKDRQGYGLLTEGKCFPDHMNERTTHNLTFRLGMTNVRGRPTMVITRLGKDEGVTQFEKKGSRFTARGAGWTSGEVRNMTDFDFYSALSSIESQ